MLYQMMKNIKCNNIINILKARNNIRHISNIVFYPIKLEYELAKNYIPDIPESLSNFYFSGRWFPYNENDIDYMGVIQQGHEIYVKVIGTTQIIAIVLDKSSSTYPVILAVKIDDRAWTRYTIDPGTTSIQIATGLDISEHYVRIMVSMKTDARFDDQEAFYFGGFTLDAGGSVLPIKPKNRTCFAIGDSITAGKNILGVYKSAAEMGYVSVMADKLNVRVIRDAHSSTGIINPAGSTYCLNYVNNIKNNLTDGYDYKPDFIIINQGQNDYNYNGVTPKIFKQKYNELIN